MHRIPARRRVSMYCKSGAQLRPARLVRAVGTLVAEDWQNRAAIRYRNSNLQPTTRRALSISFGTGNTEVELRGPNNFRFAEPGG